MTARNDFTKALQAFHNINKAMTGWSGNVMTNMPRPTYEAGWDAMACAHAKAIDEVGTTPATTLADVAAKASFIASVPDYRDVIDEWAHQSIRSLAADIAALIDRPTQDAFAVKLVAYNRAVEQRQAYEDAHRPAECEGLTVEWQAYEEALSPFHDLVFDSGRAVLLTQAPDIGALVEKRAIFDALEFWAAGDEPEVFARLFDDAMAFAGGEA